VRQALISAIELGNANPTLESLDKIAAALGVDVVDLVAPPGSSYARGSGCVICCDGHGRWWARSSVTPTSRLQTSRCSKSDGQRLARAHFVGLEQGENSRPAQPPILFAKCGARKLWWPGRRSPHLSC
jgi:Helix-turn-helix